MSFFVKRGSIRSTKSAELSGNGIKGASVFNEDDRAGPASSYRRREVARTRLFFFFFTNNLPSDRPELFVPTVARQQFFHQFAAGHGP